MAKSLVKQDKPLTPKQRKFCEEYLIDLNATQAALRAGYSKKTAKDIACQNLAKPNISEKIAELQEETRKRTLVTVDFVVNGIKTIAEEGEQENNRLKAYDLLGKHLGVYEKDNTQTVKVVSFEDRLYDNKEE